MTGAKVFNSMNTERWRQVLEVLNPEAGVQTYLDLGLKTYIVCHQTTAPFFSSCQSTLNAVWQTLKFVSSLSGSSISVENLWSSVKVGCWSQSLLLAALGNVPNFFNFTFKATVLLGALIFGNDSIPLIFAQNVILLPWTLWIGLNDGIQGEVWGVIYTALSKLRPISSISHKWTQLNKHTWPQLGPLQESKHFSKWDTFFIIILQFLLYFNKQVGTCGENSQVCCVTEKSQS